MRDRTVSTCAGRCVANSEDFGWLRMFHVKPVLDVGQRLGCLVDWRKWAGVSARSPLPGRPRRRVHPLPRDRHCLAPAETRRFPWPPAGDAQYCVVFICSWPRGDSPAHACPTYSQSSGGIDARCWINSVLQDHEATKETFHVKREEPGAVSFFLNRLSPKSSCRGQPYQPSHPPSVQPQLWNWGGGANSSLVLGPDL
jgi:hypothetical protein